MSATHSSSGSPLTTSGAGAVSAMEETAQAPLVPQRYSVLAPLQVSLSLPVFLIALPAGALADIVDRRKFLLFTQTSMVAAAGILGLLTIRGWVTPHWLIFFTVLLGVGAVMNDPAWQALTPDLVPASKLASAVALNSAGFNIAPAVVPAVGGLGIATARSGGGVLPDARFF